MTFQMDKVDALTIIMYVISCRAVFPQSGAPIIRVCGLELRMCAQATMKLWLSRCFVAGSYIAFHALCTTFFGIENTELMLTMKEANH